MGETTQSSTFHIGLRKGGKKKLFPHPARMANRQGLYQYSDFNSKDLAAIALSIGLNRPKGVEDRRDSHSTIINHLVDGIALCHTCDVDINNSQ